MQRRDVSPEAITVLHACFPKAGPAGLDYWINQLTQESLENVHNPGHWHAYVKPIVRCVWRYMSSETRAAILGLAVQDRNHAMERLMEDKDFTPVRDLPAFVQLE